MWRRLNRRPHLLQHKAACCGCVSSGLRQGERVPSRAEGAAEVATHKNGVAEGARRQAVSQIGLGNHLQCGVLGNLQSPEHLIRTAEDGCPARIRFIGPRRQAEPGSRCDRAEPLTAGAARAERGRRVQAGHACLPISEAGSATPGAHPAHGLCAVSPEEPAFQQCSRRKSRMACGHRFALLPRGQVPL